jgi:hypothetical protein
MAVGHMAPYLQTLRFVGPATVHHHLDGDHAAQLGHGAVAVGGVASLVRLPVSPGTGSVPAQDLQEQALEIEGLEVLLESRKVELSHAVLYAAISPMEHTTRGSLNAASSSL